MLTKLAGVNGNVLSHMIFSAFIIGYSYLAMWKLAGFFIKKRDAPELAAATEAVGGVLVGTTSQGVQVWRYHVPVSD